MSNKRDAFKMFFEIVEELRDLDVNGVERSSLLNILSEADAKLQAIADNLEDLPEQHLDDLDGLAEAKATVDSQKNASAQRLEYIEKRNKELAEKQAAILDAQDREYESKVAELKRIEEECEQLKSRLIRKQATIAGYEKQKKAESSQQAEQQQILKGLASKVNKAKLSEESKRFQSKSIQFDVAFSETQIQIDNLRLKKSDRLTALAAIKDENRSKSDELIVIRARTENIREQSGRKNEANRKVLNDFEAIDQLRKAQIEQKTQQLAEETAKNRNAKQTNTALMDKIHSEFLSDNLEELMTAAKVELVALEDFRSELNESLDIIDRSIESNEAKLAELNEAKDEILDQLDRTMDSASNSSSGSPHSQSYLQQSPERGDFGEMEHSESNVPVFLMPRVTRRRYEEMPPQQQDYQQQFSDEQADPVIRSADSSITGLGSSVIESVTEPSTTRERGDHDKMRVFREHFL